MGSAGLGFRPKSAYLEVGFLRNLDSARNPEFQKVVEGYAVIQMSAKSLYYILHVLLGVLVNVLKLEGRGD